ncbi:MAG: phosphatidate cytidylyltransferase [Oscillospiraceae bacterium]|nr:phosphatidate cytidylyltransferase [Oscillospiraceae bacterium]
MKDRVKSAVILILITAACMPFAPARILYFGTAGALCAYEYSKNVEKLGARCTLWVMFVYLAAHAVLTFFDMGLFCYAACFVFCLYLALFSGVLHRQVSGIGALYTLAGLTYPCVLIGIIMTISVSRIWWQTLLTAVVGSVVCDTAALFGGTRFGKHKLAPAVSPKKTVEGALCGALSSLVTGALVWLVFRGTTPAPLWLCLGTSLLGTSMGQIGDLAESLLKRMIGVKDFSNLIPGHGGVFDRADSLLFSIPTVYFCFLLAGI